MSARVRLIVALVSTGILFYVALGSVLVRVLGDTTYSQLALFNEVVRMVLDSYVEPVNVDRAMGAACRGLAEALDGESAYLDQQAFRLYNQPASGAEAEVGLVLTRRFSFLMVVSARSGSPAAAAGLRPGDVIKTIDGRHTRTIAAPVGQQMLRGQPGAVVKLTILRAGSDPIHVSLVRERLPPALPSSRVLETGEGYVRLPGLPQGTAAELRAELESLKGAGARSLVLDLRNAAHGPLDEGVKVAELFLRGGIVARVARRNAPEQQLAADATKSVWERPVAVLTTRGTAGAAEIVAAALLDAERAQVVGEPTFGIAPIQKAIPLPEGGMLLTVGKYLSPKGRSIHGEGVAPSVEVAAPLEAGAQDKDPILDRALELLAGLELRKAA